MNRFRTKVIGTAPDAIAPDGSEVRLLCQTARGSMAQFALPSKAVSRAVAHHSVEEIWCFTAGQGRMWRLLDGHDEITEVGPGVSITIPVGTHFQFRCDSEEAPLTAIGITMPPWPGEAEAYVVEGRWQATV